jgi:predicted transcriptional regulator YheO
MDRAEKTRVLELLARLTEGLGKALGPNTEIVLHDFEQLENSIFAISNGHITDRKVGDTLDVLGFQLLRQAPSTDLFNYRTNTKAGKSLRSSSIFLRDENDEIFGALCVNSDISEIVNVRDWLNRELQTETVNLEENFEHTVEEVLDRLVQSALAAAGKSAAELTREEKVAVIGQLESKGAFLIRYSVDRVAELLNLSKYTIYNYLDEIKARQSGNELTGAKSGKRGGG